MTARRQFYFALKSEAEAFVSGIEYVNDSAIEVVAVQRLGPGSWEVRVLDHDKPDETEPA